MSDQLEAATDAIEDAVRQSTVGIVNGSGSQKWQGIGTGSLIRWMGYHLILTAEHVIGETQTDDLRFFFPADVPPPKIGREALLNLPGIPTAALRPFSQINLKRLVTDSDLDLAAIVVDSDLDEKFPVRFFELAAGGRTPHEGQATIVLGFPHCISRLTNKDERVIFTESEWTQIAPNREYLGGFDATRHFLAPYNPPETFPDANPKGFSGSGMWFHIGDTPRVWHPNLDLAGVTIAWYSNARLLGIVRREAVEAFLTTI